MKRYYDSEGKRVFDCFICGVCVYYYEALWDEPLCSDCLRKWKGVLR